jgi:hypothetical protein
LAVELPFFKETAYGLNATGSVGSHWSRVAWPPRQFVVGRSRKSSGILIIENKVEKSGSIYMKTLSCAAMYWAFHDLLSLPNTQST